MIQFNLDKILKEHGISRTKFAHMAKIRPNTVNDMCNGNTKRIEIETLNKIMITINKLGNDTFDVSNLITFKMEKDD